jgi:hypothetical protein
MKPTLRARLLAAYHYFNPYHYEGDYCNPWAALLADYKHKRDTDGAVFHMDAVQAGSFAEWLIREADTSAFERMYDL